MIATTQTQPANPSITKVDPLIQIALILLAISWIGVGIQHFMYLKFVGTLVPVYMPFKLFWAGLTGGAMILAGLAFATRYKISVTAILLTIMMGVFILMIHIPKLLTDWHNIMTWTRFVQDVAIAATALMLIARNNTFVIGRYVYATAILILGVGHFAHPVFITGQAPAYLSPVTLFDNIIGTMMVVVAVGMVLHKYAVQSAITLGLLLLVLSVLNYVPGLISNVHNPMLWTPLLLELAIAAGAFVVAGEGNGYSEN